MGELLFMIAMLALWQFLTADRSSGGLIAILAGIAILLCSIFASQTYAFIMTIMAFLLNDVRLLLILPITIVITIAITNGFYWKVLTQKINLFLNYSRSSVNIASYFRKQKKDATSKSFKTRLIHFLYKSPSVIFLTRHNLLIGLLILYIISYREGHHVNIDKFLVAWMASAFSLFLLTCTRPFLFLGEAERYLEYAVIPATLLLGQVLASSFQGSMDIMLWVIISCICVPWYLLQVAAFILWSKRLPQGKDYEEFLEKMKEMPHGTVLTILHDAPWRLAYYTKHKFVWMWPQLNFKGNRKALEEFYSIYPWPHADLERYVQAYGVTIVPAEKKVLENMADEGVRYDFTNFKRVFENSRYILYKHINT
jgi:hypothetical protein